MCCLWWFQIFYPDLINKKDTPQFFLVSASFGVLAGFLVLSYVCEQDGYPGSEDFLILRFHAGPPYEVKLVDNIVLIVWHLTTIFRIQRLKLSIVSGTILISMDLDANTVKESFSCGIVLKDIDIGGSFCLVPVNIYIQYTVLVERFTYCKQKNCYVCICDCMW